MQAIYNYIPETNQVSRVYSVAAVLYLQFVLHVVLCRPLLLLILLLLRSLLSHAFSSRYLSSWTNAEPYRSNWDLRKKYVICCGEHLVRHC